MVKYERKKFTGDRTGFTHRVCIGEVKIFITVSVFSDGTPGEVFIKAGSVNSVPDGEAYPGLQGWCNSVAILISLCLQAGIDVRTICEKLLYQSFEPEGFASTDKQHAKSIVDYLARWMLKMFGKEEDENTTRKEAENAKEEKHDGSTEEGS